MKFALLHKKELEIRYLDEKMTASEIAKLYNTYTNKIIRALRYLGIEIRDKSECQKYLLESGKVKHPTKGKKLDDETKKKIGNSIHNSWKNKSEEDKEKFALLKKEAWNNRTSDEVELFNSNSTKAILDASKNGSKAEKEIVKRLKNEGFLVKHHHRPIEKEKLEVDILLPDKNIAIEIDGLSHYKPIWGDKNYERTVSADKEKNGILLTNGLCVIRIKNLANTVTNHMYDKTCKTLIEVIKRIENNFPISSDRLIYINIENGEIE